MDFLHLGVKEFAHKWFGRAQGEFRIGAFPYRSLPLLKVAVEKTTDQELKQPASFAVLESYLDTGAWKEAER